MSDKAVTIAWPPPPTAASGTHPEAPIGIASENVKTNNRREE